VLKPSSAHVHSMCSACRSPPTVSNRLGQHGPLPAWPAARRGPRPHAARARRGVLGPSALRARAVARLTVARRGQTSAGCTSQASQPMVNSPDTVESPSSKRGRRTTEGQNSPAQSTASELNGGEGVAFLVWEVAPKLKEAPGPTQWERGGVRRLGTGAAAENRGGCSGDGLPEAETARVRTRHRGCLVSRRSNTGLRKEGEREVTARRGGRATGVHTRAARRNGDVTVVVALRGGYAKGVCLYAVGSGVLDRGVALDRATQCAWACQDMVPMRHAARELEARRAARGVSKEGGSRGVA
jgi:hypothetical protein